MKNVNAKIYAIKYKLKKLLEASLNNDNEAIKNGAKITFQDYAKIQLVNCTRKTYTKEQQEILDKYAQEKGFEKQETKYLRIDIDNVPTEVDTIVDNIFNTLENTNDRVVARVASKVAR